MLISLRVLRGNGPLRSRVNPSSMSLVQPQPRKRPATRPRSTAIHRWPSSVELATTHWPWYADGINPPKQTEDEGNAARPSDGGESGTTDSIPTGIDALFTEGWWVSGNLENRSFISAIIIENCDASAWSSGILFFFKTSHLKDFSFTDITERCHLKRQLKSVVQLTYQINDSIRKNAFY